MLLSKVLRVFKSKFRDLKIRVKFILYYSVLMVAALLLSGFLYQRMHSRVLINEVGDLSTQTLEAIGSNIKSVVEMVNNYSKMILASDPVRYMLMSSKGYQDANAQKALDQYLRGIMDSSAAISSIYLFDNLSNKYAVAKTQIMALSGDLDQQDWFQEVLSRQGGYTLRLNGGGLFERGTEDSFVSHIRVVNDINSLRPIGILILNIPERSLVSTYTAIKDKYGLDIAVKDDKGQNIKGADKELAPFLLDDLLWKEDDGDKNFVIVKEEKKAYFISYLNIDPINWKVISIMPFDQISRQSTAFSVIIILVIMVNSFMVFIGAVYISRLITHPINDLIESMRGVQSGKFKRVTIETGKDEIGSLKSCYNIMISQIQKLIHRITEEQQIKRQAELTALQAQIKPHFLYNTFDAISSLALSRKTDEVYTVIKALGSFYRKSLSDGKETISLKEEIDIVRNYLVIQKTRYGDLFSDHYDIAETLKDYEVLKLILQPLVENALYHGIRPKGEKGNIYVSAKQENSFMRLIVRDDGVGIEKKIIAELEQPQHRGTLSGFGLSRTIERLRIYYGGRSIVHIDSRKGIGTQITVSIPIEKLTKHEI